MFFLSSDLLRVTILDPAHDRSRMGARFCTGGSVYQVESASGEPLLSGPEYPHPTPSVLNSQGIPDVFQFTLYHDPEEIPEQKLILGVGLVENRSRGKATDSHFHSTIEKECHWEVEQAGSRLQMTTLQSCQAWKAELKRLLQLEGAKLTVTTELTCLGRDALPFRHFAHPFFPLNTDLSCCRFPKGYHLPENEGFALDSHSLLRRNPRYIWSRGLFQLLQGDPEAGEFETFLFHPRLKGIEMRGDFHPSKVALWSNDRTFSIEPFYEGVLHPDEKASWSLEYEFLGGL
jgi:hypothetical protein